MLLVDILPRADMKNRLDGFITWGEEIILESADLFLVSSSVVIRLEAANRSLSPIGSRYLASYLRGNKNGTLGDSTKPFLGPAQGREIYRQLQRFRDQRCCPEAQDKSRRTCRY